MRSVSCAAGPESWRTVKFAILHMAFDVFTDLLSKRMPVNAGCIDLLILLQYCTFRFA